MSKWINYHHLYYFKAIAEEGTVSRAAEKLRIGQPALSAQLKQLESQLEIKLFDRINKRLVLTEQGRIALDYSRNIFRMGSEMYEVLHDRLKTARPSVQIGALDSVPKQVVLQAVKHAKRITDCQISLIEGKADELLRELQAHRIDILIASSLPSLSDAKGLRHRSLSKQPVCFFAAPKFKNLQKEFPDSISRQPLILPTYDSKMRQDLDHWAKLHKVELLVSIETQDIAVKKLMAVNGLGIIPAATHSVQGQVQRRELVKIGTAKGVTEELFLVTANRKIENPISAKLMAEFSL
jgi:LysR family transcriptional regulator, transcriptional activator of nhaA